MSEDPNVLAKSQLKSFFLPIFQILFFTQTFLFGKRYECVFFYFILYRGDIGKDVKFDFHLYRVNL